MDNKKTKKPLPIRIKERISKVLIEIILGTLARVISYVLIIIGNQVIRAGEILIKILKTPGRIFVRLVRPIHHKIGSYFPFNIKQKLAQGFIYAGLERRPEEILGVTLIYSILLPIIVSLVLTAFGVRNDMIFVGIVVSFLLVWIILVMIVVLLVERRTSSIEELLPDVLSMIAQNMIAGMTPYNSLWIAARPEFGPLAQEIQTVARDTLAGTSLEDALVAMTKRVKSDKLDRSVRLMIQGMKSGGELPTVLQEIANDMRSEQNLMKRMMAETTAQAMFIIFAILIGAPLLFGASLQFITIFSEIYEKVEAGGLTKYAQTGMMTIHPLTVKPEFFYWYAIFILIISAGFGSLLVGLIRTGKLSSGITLIPFLIAFAVLIFLGLNYALSQFFGSMIVV
jgi:pilus assembly protein TadC